MKTLIQEQLEQNGDSYKTFAEITHVEPYHHLTITRGFYSGGLLREESVPFETFLSDDGFDNLADLLRKYAISN